MKKYFTPAVLIISVIFGVLVFFIAGAFADLNLALLIGAIAALLISLSFPIGFSLGDIKYKKLMQDVSAPYIIEERVECVINGKSSHGYMVMNKESLFLLSIVDKRALRCEIKKDQIKKISVTNDFYINIFTDYNKFVRVISGNSFDITEKLKKEGFGKIFYEEGN